ncbi:hypothetical protein B0H21DRAFT_782468 [Amylocystis lapponica]|nr:hypothetical protein B0H21DRAFT_782468 [Amylocystis lapponica]
MLLHLTFLSFLFLRADAGSVAHGGACSLEHQRLEGGTYQFYTDCDSMTFCNSSTSTCDVRGCRKDIFPFGYTLGATLPPMCGDSEFCPDEEDMCLQLLDVGSPCQFNRDDQCLGPPNHHELADTTGYGLNVNGSVCLNNVCMYANVTLGQTCVVQNTAYVAYGPDGAEYPDVVSRGNCQVGLYCDSQSLQCIQTRELGQACDADKECSTYNCLASGVCGLSSDTPKYVANWVYVIVGVGIVAGMAATLVGMFFFHKKHSAIEREKRMQYWKEQTNFRENILHMQATTRNSMLYFANATGGAPSSPRSTLYGMMSEDSHMPMLQGAARSSALRYAVSDDGSEASAEQLVVPRGEKRF